MSTFTNLIDDLREEISDERLSGLADEQVQLWINRAQERISELVAISDEYVLGLNDNVYKYWFQDRPSITDASSASPIVVTAAAHGLSNLNRVTIRGVLGNTAANGRFQVSSVATNTFAISKFGDINAASYDSDTGVVTVTTDQDHGFVVGDTVTITGVTGMTDLNTSHAITAVTRNTFGVTLTTSQTYSSGGVATVPTTYSAAYTAGGRFWRDDEIPTFFKTFSRGVRTWGTDYKPIIQMVEQKWLLDQQNMDTEVQKFYSDYGTPMFGAIGMENGIRYLHVYPEPIEDKECTLFGTVRVTGRLYDQNNLSASLILPSQYDYVILVYVKMKVYEWLRERQLRMETFVEFNGAINELRQNQPAHLRVRVTYQ
jgi:hypothetical protein